MLTTGNSEVIKDAIPVDAGGGGIVERPSGFIAAIK